MSVRNPVKSIQDMMPQDAGVDRLNVILAEALVKNTLWKNVSASDGNTRKWLAKNKETVHYDEGYRGLNNPGQDCAVEILKEI